MSIMKTYSPKYFPGTMLRELLDDLHATPAQVAKFLHVTERSVFRWLADGSAPYAVLACLWFESPRGREVVACDVGNLLTITRHGAQIAHGAADNAVRRLARVLAIADTGSANDPLIDGPWSPPPVGFQAATRASYAQHVATLRHA
jgi:hypothetical protein